ncbi:hypothetical protein JSQ81_16945 [Sporosarcina sp. Marseille-Q4063]|uniref:hypothetical protein n=1 Tax=Sporosarcina sp. Marseille-Q4063 TaxID=2810514 RepID=UPI001BAF94AF|nr:hypothetical protein [Sporosarcina sp. Marseille-Q4063]QUW21465.1 hypothetical protein JSQ81_16945 [Sporosarcina sp. Marseille-Q4063]
MELQLISEKDKNNEMLNVDLEQDEKLFTSQNQFVEGPLAIHVVEKVKKTGINPKTGQPIKPLTAFVTCERYEEFEEKMLSTTITGESQINGPAYEWKKILLQWLNLKFKVIAWRVSVRKLVGLLNDSGITFNQNEQSLISPIILQWLEIFKTEVKSGLELEMNMLIRD